MIIPIITFKEGEGVVHNSHITLPYFYYIILMRMNCKKVCAIFIHLPRSPSRVNGSLNHGHNTHTLHNIQFNINHYLVQHIRDTSTLITLLIT